MKKITLLILGILFSQTILFSQSCLPEGIDFNSQTEIDSFQINYPNCTEIEGQVQILGNEIYNLNGLNVLTATGSDFAIANNDLLNDLTGLNNLAFVGGSMYFMGVDGIKNFAGLESLTTISGVLQIGYCDSLTNFSGLTSLTHVNDNIMIEFNPHLSDFSGLENLSSTGGGISIHHNNNLVNLNGINNIQASSIENLNISENENLTVCEVQSVCDYLATPTGSINIENNNTGCNSVEEVETACENVSIEELKSNELFEIFPNPAKNKLTIKNKKDLEIYEISIFNQLGEKIYISETNKKDIDISKLNIGIYIIEIKAKRNNFRKKLIVN